MFGNIFFNKFHKNPVGMTLSEIQETAIKKVSFKKYAESIVNPRGNTFENKNYGNIDKAIDTQLSSSNCKLA